MHGKLTLVGATDVHNQCSTLQYNRIQKKRKKKKMSSQAVGPALLLLLSALSPI